MNQQNNIKRNFLQSLRNTTVLLLDIALIESLKTINSDQKQIKKLLRITGSYFLERFKPGNSVNSEIITLALKKDNLDENFITNLLTRIKDDKFSDTAIDLTNVLDAMKDFVKEELRYYISFESSFEDYYIPLISKNMDFMLDYEEYMRNTINLINKSALSDEEKEKMLQITYFSYARTIATYVDSASKEFIEGAYGICHLFILKKLRKTKKVPENICRIFREDLKKASEKSIGSVKSILKIFFNYPDTIYHSTDKNKLEGMYDIYNEFVKCRNEIVHENIVKIDTFNYIMTYFKVCNDFLCDIFNEFYSGKAQDLIIENIIHLCLRVTNERSDILENLCKSKKITT
ncbi:hypothetical protein FRV13_00765 (plasmid) [Escherichia coli]|uniref:hypothetical protein n=1 Tax=Escherichia coli TaxID=562 RepID=UPI0011150B97|nr:hypothetical protein [Escherichia coli]EES4901034.1 hypothetical protein [Escherichia coli]EFC8357751.1 hypothetical protein [Escherichia coli]EFJ9272022.1 hypothetical protein [Escherichia coli]EHY1696022.1 hypothetical protein [Escherichia coli]EIG8462661.1 hypothetical protein [Escherichia coli]